MSEPAGDMTGVEYAMSLFREAEEVLAPGVIGTVLDRPDGFYLLLIRAVDRGTGAVGRYLDSLPTDRPVKVPGVISSILAGMLQRRGFHRAEFSSDPDRWERFPS